MKKGVAATIMFMMVDATDFNTPETSVTVAVAVSKDGGAFAAATNTPATEVANGWYKITLTATEMAANTIAVKATGSGCAQQNLCYYPDTEEAGAIEWTYTITDGVNPIADVDVWVTTDIAGANVIASGRTNASGVVTFYLDAGTVYVWCQKSNYTFSNPDTEVIS